MKVISNEDAAVLVAACRMAYGQMDTTTQARLEGAIGRMLLSGYPDNPDKQNAAPNAVSGTLAPNASAAPNKHIDQRDLVKGMRGWADCRHTSDVVPHICSCPPECVCKNKTCEPISQEIIESGPRPSCVSCSTYGNECNCR